MAEYKIEIAKAVKRARTKRKVTQIRLSKMIGCTNVSLSQIESGAIKPSFRTLERIADKLNYKLLITIKFKEWEQ